METIQVLVVDDEPGMRSGITRVLSDYKIKLPDISEEFNFTISLAETGEQALDMITGSHPDILLLDHKLPGISGLEVLERVVSLNSEMITVMITAYASLETAVSAIKRGAFDFLAKPFTPGELKSTITKAAQSLILSRQVRKLAEEKRQVRFQFISVLGHELKAPLGAVEGYLYMIKDRTAGNDPAVYDTILHRCLIRTEQMRKLIGDLLEMTRIESGQKKRELVELNVGDIAQCAIETVTPDAVQRNINITLHNEYPVTMKADRGEIEIILNNLISNSVKYNRDNGRVDVFIGKENERITIEAKDTGIGMSQEEVARLFSEFVRIKNEKTRHILGSGLGLSIIKKIVQLYDGEVTITSQPDVGSAFRVVL